MNSTAKFATAAIITLVVIGSTDVASYRKGYAAGQEAIKQEIKKQWEQGTKELDTSMRKTAAEWQQQQQRMEAAQKTAQQHQPHHQTEGRP